jgi:hypothetical protein
LPLARALPLTRAREGVVGSTPHGYAMVAMLAMLAECPNRWICICLLLRKWLLLGVICPPPPGGVEWSSWGVIWECFGSHFERILGVIWESFWEGFGSHFERILGVIWE